MPEVMLPGRALHVARVARAPTPCQCAHVATWKVAPTAPTASPGPRAPAVPCCSWQDKARQHKKSAMSAWPLQRSARAWNPRSWQHPRKVEARHGQRAVRRSGAPPSLHTQERSIYYSWNGGRAWSWSWSWSRAEAVCAGEKRGRMRQTCFPGSVIRITDQNGLYYRAPSLGLYDRFHGKCPTLQKS